MPFERNCLDRKAERKAKIGKTISQLLQRTDGRSKQEITNLKRGRAEKRGLFVIVGRVPVPLPSTEEPPYHQVVRGGSLI